MVLDKELGDLYGEAGGEGKETWARPDSPSLIAFRKLMEGSCTIAKLNVVLSDLGTPFVIARSA
jgi:hypothetical protein